MSWLRRPKKLPSETQDLHRRAREAKEYVDREVGAARRRHREVMELAGWQQRRRLENHLTELFHTGRGRA